MKNVLFIITTIIVILSGLTLVLAQGSFNAEKANEVQNTCSAGSNPKDSLIMSAITMCIPGVLEKTYEFRQLQCQRVVCHYNLIKEGVSPSYCDKQFTYRTCEFVVGQIFAIPPLALVDYYRDAMKQLLENPIGIAFSEAAKEGRKWLDFHCPDSAICKSPAVGPAAFALFVIDITAAYDTIEKIFNEEYSAIGWSESTTNYCEELDDIKGEMERIVNAN